MIDMDEARKVAAHAARFAAALARGEYHPSGHAEDYRKGTGRRDFAHLAGEYADRARAKVRVVSDAAHHIGALLARVEELEGELDDIDSAIPNLYEVEQGEVMEDRPMSLYDRAEHVTARAERAEAVAREAIEALHAVERSWEFMESAPEAVSDAEYPHESDRTRAVRRFEEESDRLHAEARSRVQAALVKAEGLLEKEDDR